MRHHRFIALDLLWFSDWSTSPLTIDWAVMHALPLRCIQILAIVLWPCLHTSKMCFSNNVIIILNRAYVKNTDNINRVNGARSHTDCEYISTLVLLQMISDISISRLGNGFRSSYRMELNWTTLAGLTHLWFSQVVELIIWGGHGAKRKKNLFGGSPKKKFRQRGLKKKKKNYDWSIYP